MANTTFNGPVRSENGFNDISVADSTGTVTTNSTFSNNTSIGGTLAVTGNTTLTGDLTVAGSLFSGGLPTLWVACSILFG